MKVEFSSHSGRDSLNPSAQTGRLLNCYREPLVPGGKGQYQIRAVPGMEPFSSIDRVLMRALTVYDGKMLAICGGALFRADRPGVILADVGESADTTVSQNTGVLTIAANGTYQTWDGTALATPAPGALSDPGVEIGSVSYLGGYTILTERDGRRFQWSALADPKTFSGLDFASAETTDAPIIRGVVWRDVLMLFKRDSLEQWTRTGLASAKAFQRIPGGDIETGLADFGLVTLLPNGLAFVGSDGRVYIWGGSLTPISTPPVEVMLTEKRPERMFFYERRGHGFICLVFRDAPAWCYDVATGEWHERGEDDGPWSARASVKFNGKWFVGTDTGQVARLSSRCADFGRPLVRRARSLPVANAKPFIVHRVELFPRVGMDRQSDAGALLDDDEVALGYSATRILGDDGADGREAQIGIRTSRDGLTWGPLKERSLGQPGRFQTVVKWLNLGQFRRMASFELVLSSTTDIPIISTAEVEIS